MEQLRRLASRKSPAIAIGRAWGFCKGLIECWNERARALDPAFWLLLGFGFSCGLVFLVYEQLLRLLSQGARPQTPLDARREGPLSGRSALG